MMQPKDTDPSHMYVSFCKSGLRVLAGIFLILSGMDVIMYAGLLLVVAELLGVLEEIF